METLLLNILTVSAWTGAVIGLIWLSLCIFWTIHYEGSIEQMADKIKGFRREFPIGKPALISLVSIVYLIAKAMG
jgi:hypothetical protein